MSLHYIRIPASISNLLKTITRTFYSDLHIQVIDLILRLGYTSEYIISKELEIKIEKVKLVANSLYNENFIKFDDRIFKKQKQRNWEEKNDLNRKIYKIRFWFIDSNSFVWSLKERIKKIFLRQKKSDIEKEKNIFKCPRKICKKLFSAGEIAGIPFDHMTGVLTCNNFLNQKVVCGTALTEIKEDKINFVHKNQFKQRKENIQEFKPIVEALLYSSKFL